MAWTNARIKLFLCLRLTSVLGGWVIRQKADQQAAEILLKEMWTRTGWDVAASIQSLREQWADEETDC